MGGRKRSDSFISETCVIHTCGLRKREIERGWGGREKGGGQRTSNTPLRWKCHINSFTNRCTNKTYLSTFMCAILVCSHSRIYVFVFVYARVCVHVCVIGYVHTRSHTHVHTHGISLHPQRGRGKHRHTQSWIHDDGQQDFPPM